jgi:beta-glucosidase
MMSTTTYRFAKQLIEEGKITEEQIDAAVLRVLSLKERLGLFENPYRAASEEEEKTVHLCAENRALARLAAEEASVLLKNDGTLPFSKDVKTVALIGPFAEEKGINGFWVCAGRDEDCVTVAEGVRNLLPEAEILTAKGCTWEMGATDVSGVEDAAKVASRADAVVLCLGEYQKHSGESNSRASISLSPAQIALARAVVAANPNTAVLLFNGRPLAIAELDAIAPAILTVWQPGSEGGNAAARLLFGEANPCGKLSMSFPYVDGQCPVYYNRLRTGRPARDPKIAGGSYSSRYMDAPVDPLYVFGHGLSYNTYAYDNLILSDNVVTPNTPIEVAVTVKNEGKYVGKEIVQLYIRDRVASVVRPIKELKDFAKVELEPGESALITFTLTAEDLAFHTASGEYTAEPGEFDVFVGKSSDDYLSASFRFEK